MGLEHIGSAHDEVELAVLMAAARDRLEQLQPALDLGIEVPARAARMVPAPGNGQFGLSRGGRVRSWCPRRVSWGPAVTRCSRSWRGCTSG